MQSWVSIWSGTWRISLCNLAEMSTLKRREILLPNEKNSCHSSKDDFVSAEWWKRNPLTAFSWRAHWSSGSSPGWQSEKLINSARIFVEIPAWNSPWLVRKGQCELRRADEGSPAKRSLMMDISRDNGRLLLWRISNHMLGLRIARQFWDLTKSVVHCSWGPKNDV